MPPPCPGFRQACCASIARARVKGGLLWCCSTADCWPRTSRLHSSLLCHYGKIGYLHYQKFHPLQKRIFRPLCIAQQTIVVLHRLGHGRRTPSEAFLQWYPKLLGLGRQIRPILSFFWHLGYFRQNPFWWVPCSCFPIINQYLYKKTKLLYSYSKYLFEIVIWIWAVMN